MNLNENKRENPYCYNEEKETCNPITRRPIIDTDPEQEMDKHAVFRFMAMSKFIGIIAFGFVFIITVYSMVEMHNTQVYSALPQLIVSSFAFATVYAGFYLLMAKVEHVEVEKTKREKELVHLKMANASIEEITGKQLEIKDLTEDIGNILDN